MSGSQPPAAGTVTACPGHRSPDPGLDQLQHCLAGHFDFEHSTAQFEPAGHAAHEHPAHA